jgi:V-type H+-transporting ATPase subunit a
LYKDVENQDCTYLFGMDPSWALSTNYLTFTNNIKEKLSVIIAYSHLNLGMFLAALNAIHFKHW